MAGAIIDDDTGEMKTKSETDHVFCHFRPLGQFLGFPGSLGLFQVTRLGSLEASALMGGLGVRVLGHASRSWSWLDAIGWILRLVSLVLRFGDNMY